MDILAVVTVVAAIVGIIAGIVQVLDYLRKRREKANKMPSRGGLVGREVEGSQARVRIYVSSTYSDLAGHRRRVYERLREMRYDVIAMEDYVATDERPLGKCLADVASCQVYVGIFAWRYGTIPPGQERSITELEYRQAGESGLERLIFLLDEDAPWPPGQMDSGVSRGKIEALRQELMAAHVVGFFKKPEDLAGQAAASVAEWARVRLDALMDRLRARRDQADKARREMRERQRVVNLRPLDVTHTFKNRVREMETLCNYLADDGVRLVSVVGRGGMGKTALACRVLADLERGVLPMVDEEGEQRQVPLDGIIYLSARSTGLGLERIYADVGRMLGEPVADRLAVRWADEGVPLTVKIEYLLETMRDGLYLILLDNLENYLTEDSEIAEEGLRLFIEYCLTRPGGVRLVVTSREEVKIAAAALRSARRISLREGLPVEDAVALLHDLDPQGTLGLHAGPEDVLRRAAHFTRGIPRALEILAGILHEDPAASLTELLDDEQLFGEQVVEQLVTEGYRRLGEDERRVMEALAVFDRPVEEAAIAYLLHPWLPGLDVRAKLRRLARGHFVSINRVTGEYSLHPLDGEYAYHQIPSSPDRDGEPSAYSRWNLELRAADFYASIRKPESEWKMIDDLEPQLVEFEHRVRAGDYDGACQTLDPIDSDYLYLWGHYARLVELRRRLLQRLMNSRLQADNLGKLGRAYYSLGQIERAIKFHEQALKIAEGIDDRAEVGQHFYDLGNSYYSSGQTEQAIRFYEQALAIAREIDDRRREAHCLHNLGLAYRFMGQVERARKYCEEALATAREINDRWVEGVSLGTLGGIHSGLGQVEQAIRLHEQALAIAREIGARWVEQVHLGSLGRAYRGLGRLEEAIQHCTEALAIAREIGDRRKESAWLGGLGRAYRDLGQIEYAIEFYQEALVIACETGDRREESNRLGDLGNAYRDLGQSEQAIKFYQEAVAIARGIGYRQILVIWLGNLGIAYQAIGQIERAIQLYKEALSIGQEIEYRLGDSYQLLESGRALLASGRLREASQCCTEALALEMPETSYRAALALGIVLLRQQASAAGEAFANAVGRCWARLDKTSGLHQERYALAAALVGSVVCDTRWTEEGEQARLLAPALAKFQQALEITSAPGIVRDALWNLEMIGAAGVEGLEPVFELLEAALQQHDH